MWHLLRRQCKVDLIFYVHLYSAYIYREASLVACRMHGHGTIIRVGTLVGDVQFQNLNSAAQFSST